MTDAHKTYAASHDEHAQHEASDVNIAAILKFGGALLVVGVVIHVLVWLLFTYFSNRESRQAQREFPLAAGQADRLPPEPRLQTNPREDLAALRAKEDDILRSYGWVDRNGGVVRIPIENAMRLVIQRGLPARESSDEKR